MSEKKIAQVAQEAKSPLLSVNSLKANAAEIAAYGGLVITLILFFIFSREKLAYNLSVVLQAASPYCIIALGAMFIYSMGFMDVSVSQQVGVYAIVMTMIANKIGGTPGIVVGFLAVLALAMACGAFNGAVSVLLGLPSIVTSLFLMFFFTGAQLLLMESTGDGTINLIDKIRPADRNTYNVILISVIVAVGVIVTYLFNFTRLGKYTRAIGANPVVAAQSGVNTTKWKVIAYMAFGACVALGSLVMLSRTGSAGKGTGSGYAMDIMICLILGGMPLSGGMRSKVRCAIIGTFTFVLLSNDLTTMGVPLEYINFVKSIIFLAIVLITCRKKDGILPR